MTSIVLIETNGTVKTLKAKEMTADTLYKKCGFRVADDFVCRHTWRVRLKKSDEERFIVSVWAKKIGKANFENKYDFPPPIDKELYFGTCAIVRTSENDENKFIDLTKEMWEKIYEKLFGGFEELGDEDEYSEDELANVDPSLLTAHGYLKDDFVVSDKEAIDDSAESGKTTPVNFLTKSSKKNVGLKTKATKTTKTTKATKATKERMTMGIGRTTGIGRRLVRRRRRMMWRTRMSFWSLLNRTTSTYLMRLSTSPRTASSHHCCSQRVRS